MPKKTVKKIEEVVETKKLTGLNLELGRDDLNTLVAKINEVIEYINAL